MRIAVVGTGISGLVVAHHLHRTHDLTVFEADDRIGGHTNTVEVDLPDGRFAVDTGFIVCNERTYPGFLGLLHELDVPTQPSEMSFSVSDDRVGWAYRAANPSTLYAQRSNLLRPRFHRLVADIVRSNRALRRVARSEEQDPTTSLGDWLERQRYGPELVERFVVPLGASIWSADPATFLDFPVLGYARFLDHHGLLDVRGRPSWRTVTGGSTTYVRALVAPFRDRIRTSTPVHKVVRRNDTPGIEILSDHGVEHFDRVVLATHSDQALQLLGDATPAEREVLGAIRYQRNVATLHTDARLLPLPERARASWNFHVAAGDGHATLTYWMNRLQAIPTATPLLVTLNRDDAIDPELVLHRDEYHHPVFDTAAVLAQRRRSEFQGHAGTFFAGAYWANGFHEDGVQSAFDVLRAMGER